MDEIEQAIMAIINDTETPISVSEMVQLLNDTYNIRLVRQKVYTKMESLKRYNFLERTFNGRCFLYREA